ncbi:MAG: tetratricopeptide repeat protein [Anaerolineae bacterium]|nr:tetratricopeptide repeat protein [Anaerolineae bacterium]
MRQPVFISYSRENKPLLDQLVTSLDAEGIPYWVDEHNLPLGSPDWEEMLRMSIRSASAVLLLATPESRLSAHVRDELAYARDEQRIIYPLWMSGDKWTDVIPFGFGYHQYIDIRGERYDSGMQRLVGYLREEQALPPEAQEETAPPPPVHPRNPYKSLRAFRGDDRHDFFGRDLLIEELLDSLRQDPRFLVLLGASGSGKSSVIMAGLIPALRDGALPGSSDWLYLDPVQPGQHPLENLTVALARDFPDGRRTQRAIREDLETPNKRGLLTIAKEMAPRGRVVLYLDQFEEIFTLTESEAEREHFIYLLTTAAGEFDSPLTIILSMRADFLDRPLQYPLLGDLLKQHTVPVRPMRYADLVDVVQKPAMQPDVQIAFEADLVNRLIYDVREEAGALPLLQFTLHQLFEKHENRLITHEAYEAIGGVRGALARHAEATYNGLPSDEHRQLARALFLRLIDPGASDQEATRRPASMRELELLDPAQSDMLREVGRAFITARLLIAEEEKIELSHEALIREWDRLGEWLHESRADIELTRAISADAQAWRRDGSNPESDKLYTGTELDQALAWSTRSLASADDMYFIQASEARRDRRLAAEEVRRAREARTARVARLAGVIAGLLLLAAVIFGLTIIGLAGEREQTSATLAFAQNEGTRIAAQSGATLAAATARLAEVEQAGTQVVLESTRAGATAESRLAFLSAGIEDQEAVLDGLRFTSEAQRLQAQGNPFLAGALALEGLNNPDLPGYARSDLVNLLLNSPVRRRYEGTTNFINDLDVSPDGRLAVTTHTDGTIVLWDLETGAVRQRIQAWWIQATGVTFVDGGSAVLAGSGYGDLKIWDVASGELRADLGRQPSSISALDYDPASNTLLISTCAETYYTLCPSWMIATWDLDRQTEIQHITGDTGWIAYVALAPGGQSFAATLPDGTVRRWSSTTGEEELNYLQSDGSKYTSPATVRFTPDGSGLLINADAGGELALVDVETGRELRYFSGGHTGWAADASFSRDGLLLATGGSDGTVVLWDVTTGRPMRTFRGHTGPLRHVMMTANDARLLSIGEEADMIEWRIDPAPVVQRSLGHTGGIWWLDVSPDETQVLTGGADHKVILWDVASGEILHEYDHHQGQVYSVAFHPTERLALSSGEDGDVVIWNLDTGAIIQRLQPGMGTAIFATFSPDGRSVLTSSIEDRTMLLWDLDSGQVVERFTGHYSAVIVAAFYDQGRRILSGGSDWTVGEWEVANPLRYSLHYGHTNTIYAVAVSPDETMALSGGRDNQVKLWNLGTGELIRTFEPRHTAEISDLVFTPDGQRALSSSADGTIILWDVNTGEALQTFTWHSRSVRALAVIDGGRQVLSAGFGGTMLRWELLDADSPSLIPWLHENTEVGALTCIERDQYGITPACDAAAHLADGERMLLLTRNDEALVNFEHALDADPDSEAARIGIARTLVSTGSLDRARTTLDTLLTANPDSADGHLWRGIAIFQQGLLGLVSFEDAIDDLRAAIELSGGANASAESYLGWAHYHMEQYDEAQHYFDLALEHEPDPGPQLIGVPGAFEGRGWVHYFTAIRAPELDKPAYVAAISDFTQAIEHGLILADNFSGLGWSYYQLGDYESALKAFNTAIDIDQNWSTGLYGRAFANAQLGNLDQALEDITRATDMGLTAPDALQLKEQLEAQLSP